MYAKSSSNKLSVDYLLGDYYYPYVDKHQDNNGCLSYFVMKVFESQGVKLGEIRWFPWSVAMKSLNYIGSATVSFPWSYTKARAEKYLYSDALYTKSAYIWVLATQKEKFRNFDQLQGEKVCIPQGYGAYGQMQALFDQKKAIRVTSLTMQDCFNQLKNNTIAAVYAGDDAIRNIAEIKNSQGLFVKAFTADKQTHYLIAGKDQSSSRELISLFNNGLKTLKFDPILYCKLQK